MIDKEWLKRKIETDPDCEVDAGTMHPEAPMTLTPDALVSKLKSRANDHAAEMMCRPEETLYGKAADAIARLTRERDEARRDNLTSRNLLNLSVWLRDEYKRRLEIAEAERDAARRELATARNAALEEAAACADNGVECCGSPIEQWDDDGSGNPVFRGSECCNSPRPKYPNEIANDIRALKTEA